MILLAGTTTFATVLLVLAPLVARRCDRRPARRRVVALNTNGPARWPRAGARRRPTDVRAIPASHPRDVLVARADACEQVARSIRAGESVDAALGDLGSTAPDDPWRAIRAGVAARRPLVVAVDDALTRAHGDDARVLDLVASCVTGHTFDPDGLDTVAAVLRDRHALHGELRVATAQARLTLRLLTALPLAGGALALIGSATVRRGVVSGALVPILVVGLLLNVAGRAWTARAVARTLHRAGSGSPVADEAAVALRSGRGVAEVLAGLRGREGGPDAAGLERMLGRALRDGLPVADVAARLGVEVRARRRRDVDAAVRRLPAVLAFPVVLCVLPSFLLLGVVPLLVAATTHLGPTVG